MLETAPAGNHSASAVTGSPWSVVRLEVLDGYRLRAWFRDGVEGVVDLKAFVHRADAGVFADLTDQNLFAEAYVDPDFGAVVWPSGLDLAPDAMHDEIKARGVWVL